MSNIQPKSFIGKIRKGLSGDGRKRFSIHL